MPHKYIIRRKIATSDKPKYNYYYNNSDKKITDEKLLKQLYSIYIAPAYTDVKIYLKKDVLATGIDSAGRKQYIYSELSKKKRELKKYNQLIELSDKIISLKKKINKDLLSTQFDKNKMIALILKIMDMCNFRCGNKVYEKKYGSYGLTTLHKKHVKINPNNVKISFIGKKGVLNECIIKNKKVQDIIKKMYSMSNKKEPYIFSLIKDGNNVNVSVQDVNKYLEEFNITSKNLRTWNANVIFIENFKKEVDQNLDKTYFALTDNTKKENIKKKLIKEAIYNTSHSLHHTPTICKSSYIYKNILSEILQNDNIVKKLYHKEVDYEDFLKSIL